MRDTKRNLFLEGVSVIVLRVLSMIHEWVTLNTPHYIYLLVGWLKAIIGNMR